MAGRWIMFFLLLAQTVMAEIVVEVDNIRPSIDETFNVRVSFINTRKSDYELVGIENFDILSRGTSSNTSYINGKKSSKYSINYQVMAKAKGIYSLQAISKKEESNIMEIEAVELRRSIKPYYMENSLVEERSYYFGEKIPYEEKLITTVNISDLGYISRANFGTLSVRDIPMKNYIQKNTRVDGREALELTVFQGIVEANSSGRKDIEGGVLQVVTRGRDVFSSSKATLRGPKTSIDILPLPENEPSNFTGIVGTLSGQYSIDSKESRVGEAITLKISLFGSGGLKNLESINNNRLEDFDVYENIIREDEEIRDGRYYNEKVFEVALVPNKEGEIKTPLIVLPYFNTVTKKYDEFKVEPIEVVVKKGKLIDNNEAIEKQESASIVAPNKEILVVGEIPDKKDSILIYILGTLVVVEGVVILYLIGKRYRRGEREDEVSLTPLKRASSSEVYDAYCEYMKKKYSYNPRAHSLDRTKGLEDEVAKLAREIEEERYRGIDTEKKKIINILKKYK